MKEHSDLTYCINILLERMRCWGTQLWGDLFDFEAIEHNRQDRYNEEHPVSIISDFLDFTKVYIYFNGFPGLDRKTISAYHPAPQIEGY